MSAARRNVVTVGMKAVQAIAWGALIVALMSVGMSVQSAWAQELAAGEVNVGAAAEANALPTTLVTQATEYPYRPSGDVYISVSGRTSGSATYNESTKTLTLSNLVADDVDVDLPSQSISVAKKAFAKAGKNNGKGLTLKLGSSGIYRKEVAKYRKFLKSRGLSGKVKLKTY